MPQRERLPEKRTGYTAKGKVENTKFYVIVNFYEGRDDPGEVFCHVAKEGSTLAGLIDTWMLTLSVALQHGAVWPVLREHYRHHKFEPRDQKFESLTDAISAEIDRLVSMRAEQIKKGDAPSDTS